MPVLVVGTMQGERRRAGTLDNGQPWSVHEGAVRGAGDFDGTVVRLESFDGPVPREGEFVALAGELRGGKFHAHRRLAELEQALQPSGK